MAAVLLLVLVWTGPACGAEPVEVRIRGLEGASLENVRAALAPPPGLVRNGQPDSLWLERFRHQVPQLVRQALEPFGYFSPTVEAELLPQADQKFVLDVAVTTGEPVRVATLHLVLSGPGRDEPELQRQAAAFPLHVGDVLRQDLYEEGKGSLKARAIDLGYLDAKFTVHRLDVALGERTAALELELATGPVYFFGSPLIHGAPDYPAPFLRRYLDFRPGERFSYQQLRKTQVNFLDSDRFSEVLITPQRELATGQDIPIGIQLVPSPRRRLRPGIGYGTDTGARGSLRYQDVNIFHLGHELKIEGGISQVLKTLGADYLMPSPSGLNNLTALHLNLNREETDTYTSNTVSIEVERIQRLAENLLGSVYLQLLREDYQVGLTDNRSRLLMPGVRLTLSDVSDPIRPRSGYRLYLEVRGSHKAIVSDTDLLQVLGDANLLLPLPWRLSLLARGQGAMTLQSDPLEDIPASLRFFAGGDHSVRGYPYQSLGPRDASGEVVGGKQLLVGSLELERAIGEHWGVAGFYDVGNAFNSLGNIEWAEGAGVGVRYYTLVGPIHLDLAKRVGPGTGAYRVHFSVGLSW